MDNSADPDPSGSDQTTEIIFPGRVPGNNGRDGLMRMSIRQKKLLKAAFARVIALATRNRHVGPLRFELVRHSVGPVMDYDNLVSTGKLITDQLVAAGVIPDDKPEIITERDYRQKRALSKDAQFTLIRIIDL